MSSTEYSIRICAIVLLLFVYLHLHWFYSLIIVCIDVMPYICKRIFPPQPNFFIVNYSLIYLLLCEVYNCY